MALDVSFLGPLYGQIGYDTHPDTVAKRLQGAEAAAALVTKQCAPALIRAAYGLNVSANELDAIRKPFSEADPTFAPAYDSPEMRLLAAGLLKAAIDFRPKELQPIAILIGCASFGGMRTTPMFEDFAAQIEAVLDGLYDRAAANPKVVPALGALPKTQFDGLAEKITANDFAGALTGLQAAAGALGSLETANAEKLRTALNALVADHLLLTEQMRQYWWVINGYSVEAKKPFSEMKFEEASLRAGRELAGRTEGEVGQAGAPALIANVLSAVKSPKPAALSSFVTKVPIDWRRTFTGSGPSGVNAVLTPVSFAIHLATGANDEQDWKARFKREAAFDAATELSPIDVAHQVYREALVLRWLDD